MGAATKESNRRRISDEKERGIALAKGEARKVPAPWDEKQQEQSVLHKVA